MAIPRGALKIKHDPMWKYYAGKTNFNKKSVSKLEKLLNGQVFWKVFNIPLNSAIHTSYESIFCLSRRVFSTVTCQESELCLIYCCIIAYLCFLFKVQNQNLNYNNYNNYNNYKLAVMLLLSSAQALVETGLS